MASGKTNYFRHSFLARHDEKLNAFMGLFGRDFRDGYFYFFTLLELCAGDAHNGKTEFTHHPSVLRSLWRTSALGVHEVCTKFAASGLLVCTQCTSGVVFSIPNLREYTGKYEKNAPNKEIKQIKESKETEVPKKNLPKAKPKAKPKTAKIESSPLAFLFKPDDEIQAWLISEGSSEYVQKELLETYSHHVLAAEVKTAFQWQLEKESRNAGLFLKNWIKNKKHNGYNPQSTTLEDDLADFFKSSIAASSPEVEAV